MNTKNILYMSAIRLPTGRIIDDSFNLNLMIPHSQQKSILVLTYKKGDIFYQFDWIAADILWVSVKDRFMLSIN